MNVYDIIKTVRITEKGARQSEEFNQYTLVADRRASKTQIRAAVEELFDVKVVDIRTMNVRGKWRRKQTRQVGKTSDWKKAMVTLKEGDAISLV